MQVVENRLTKYIRSRTEITKLNIPEDRIAAVSNLLSDYLIMADRLVDQMSLPKYMTTPSISESTSPKIMYSQSQNFCWDV